MVLKTKCFENEDIKLKNWFSRNKPIIDEKQLGVNSINIDTKINEVNMPNKDNVENKIN